MFEVNFVILQGGLHKDRDTFTLSILCKSIDLSVGAVCGNVSSCDKRFMTNKRSKDKAKMGENVAGPPPARIEGGNDNTHSESYTVTTQSGMEMTNNQEKRQYNVGRIDLHLV